MLPSPIQTNASISMGNSTANSFAPAPAEPAMVDAAANVPSPDASLFAEAGSELFSAQLNDAFVTVEQPLTEITHEQSAVDVSEQPPSAEEWLLAMLDQQQLQLHARDTLTPASLDTASIMQLPADATVLGPVEAEVNGSQATVGNSFETKHLPVRGLENSLTRAPINTEENSNPVASVNRHELIGKAIANPLFNNGSINSDAITNAHTTDDSNNVTVMNSVNSTAINSTASTASLAVAGAGIEINSNQLVAPALVNANGDDAVQRTAQSPLSLHTPDAKWGEQLLHTLRDNVHVQIQQKIQNATIRLDPPELGSLEIYLSHEAGRLNVHITASQADVARLIQHTSDRLRQELAGPQFTQVNVHTSAEGQGGQQQSRERQRFVNDELIFANEQPLVSNEQPANRSGDVLVTV